MPDTEAVVRATGASRRQVDIWRQAGYLQADIDHGRAEYAPAEIVVARALATLSVLGVMPSGPLACAVRDAIRTPGTARVTVGAVTVDLRKLARP